MSQATEMGTDKIRDLEARKAHLREGGGTDRLDKQHQSGKLSARERVERLLDAGTFQEIGMFARHHATRFGMADKELAADGVVTGCGTVDRRGTQYARAAAAPPWHPFDMAQSRQ